MKQKICPYCDNKTNGNYQYCPLCGNELIDADLAKKEALCKRCGQRVDLSFNKHCPQCGLPLTTHNLDYISKEELDAKYSIYRERRPREKSTEGSNKSFYVAVCVIMVCLFCGFMAFAKSTSTTTNNQSAKQYTPNSTKQEIASNNTKKQENHEEQKTQVTEQNKQEEMYINELDRRCRIVDSTQKMCWDKVTKSYFYFADTNEPFWLYWFNGISSDYPESGWMYFDSVYGHWHIQNSDLEWVVLDTKKYDTSNLWHFDNVSFVPISITIPVDIVENYMHTSEQTIYKDCADYIKLCKKNHSDYRFIYSLIDKNAKYNVFGSCSAAFAENKTCDYLFEYLNSCDKKLYDPTPYYNENGMRVQDSLSKYYITVQYYKIINANHSYLCKNKNYVYPYVSDVLVEVQYELDKETYDNFVKLYMALRKEIKANK